jgi:hypothetical protein
MLPGQFRAANKHILPVKHSHEPERVRLTPVPLTELRTKFP